MMKTAMILAAGLGTRLKPLTDRMPKALVPYEGVPLIERLMLRLREAGFTRTVINVHHFADMLEDFIRSRDGFGLDVAFSDERDLLRDTGRRHQACLHVRTHRAGTGTGTQCGHHHLRNRSDRFYRYLGAFNAAATGSATPASDTSGQRPYIIQIPARRQRRAAARMGISGKRHFQRFRSPRRHTCRDTVTGRTSGRRAAPVRLLRPPYHIARNPRHDAFLA